MDAKPLRLTTGSLQVYVALENPETCRQGEKCFPEIDEVQSKLRVLGSFPASLKERWEGEKTGRTD